MRREESGMFDWNVIVTVMPGAGRDSALPASLREYGEFRRATPS